MEKPTLSRRSFLATSIKTGIVFGLPTIVPSSVFGKNAPSNRINIGAIGNGRISRTHDMPGVWKYDNARIIAVCDVDSKRATEAQTLVNDVYTKKATKRYKGVKTYTDYRELLQNKDIDAVLISTPDHWRGCGPCREAYLYAKTRFIDHRRRPIVERCGAKNGRYFPNW
jgi:hypothetical protein